MWRDDDKMETTIEKAKTKVIRACGGNLSVRNWLEATPDNSYDDPEYQVTLFVLSGSPPKGYVLADYNSGIVKAFGLRMKPLYTYHAYRRGG